MGTLIAKPLTWKRASHDARWYAKAGKHTYRVYDKRGSIREHYCTGPFGTSFQPSAEAGKEFCAQYHEKLVRSLLAEPPK